MKKRFLLILTIFCILVPAYSQVLKTVNVAVPGTLSGLLTEEEKTTVTDLTITGTIDSMDFITLRDFMPVLASLDLSGASTVNDAIYHYALGPKTSLTSLILPPTTRRIGVDAFQSCSFTELIIPPSVTVIQHGAFRYADIQEITLPSSVKILESYIFASCNSLQAIYVDEDNTEFSSTDGVLFSKDGTVLISCPPAKSGTYSIPSTVTEIMDWGFSECDEIESISIPASVNKIGISFYHNISLTGFQVDAGNLFYRDIEGVLFTSDTSMLVQFPLNKPGDSYSIPHGTEKIGEASFRTSHLLHVYFPSSLTEIDANAFRNSVDLVSLELPPSLKIIGMYAFGYSPRLQSIRLPSSLETVGRAILYGAVELDTIMVNSETPFELSSAFAYFNNIDTNNCILLVPAGSADAYASALHWKKFQNIVEYDTHFEISQDQFDFSASGGQTTFEITSNTEWRIKSNEPWLHFSDTLGMDNQTITVTVPANPGADRQATVAVQPLEKEGINLLFTQAGTGTSTEDVTDSKERIFFDRTQQCLTVLNLSGNLMSLYSVEGRLIYKKRIVEDHENIPASSFPEGIYIVRSGSYASRLPVSR